MPAVAIVESLAVSPEAVFREIEGEAVILSLDTGMYFGLDPVGTRIWRLIEQHQALSTVLAALKQEYDGDPAVIEAGLLRLVEELLDKGLLRRTTP